MRRRDVFIKRAGDVQQHRRDCRADVDEALARAQFNGPERLLDHDGSRHVGVERAVEGEGADVGEDDADRCVRRARNAGWRARRRERHVVRHGPEIEKALTRIIISVDER